MQDLCSKHTTVLIVILMTLVVSYYCEYSGQQDDLNMTVVGLSSSSLAKSSGTFLTSATFSTEISSQSLFVTIASSITLVTSTSFSNMPNMLTEPSVSPSSDSTSSRASDAIVIVIVLLLSFVIIIAVVCICACCLFLTTNKRNLKRNGEQTVQLTRLTTNKFVGSSTETIYPPRSPTLSLSSEGNSPLKTV